MWAKLARFILTKRIPILMVLALITIFMGYQATKVKTTYTVAQLLPDSDTSFIQFQDFKQKYGDEGSAFFIGTSDTTLFELEKFKGLFELSERLEASPIVDSIFSLTHLYKVEKNKEEKKFELVRVMNKAPESQEECDSLKREIYNLPFYEGIIYLKEDPAFLIALTLNSDMVNSKLRDQYVYELKDIAEEYAQQHDVKFHYSGMPYIRTIVSNKIKAESKMFILYAIIVTAVILFFFLRSFKAVFFSLIVVGTGVVWSLGIMGWLGYEITILTGLIPPLIIIIGIPNCIFLLNKYFAEYKSHGNQAKALTRVIQKIGNATLMTNATTASGFATFVFTQSDIMIEFGIVASINIMCVFLLSILLIPISYSFQSAPKVRHTKHLDRKWMKSIIIYLEKWVLNHRITVYAITIVLVLIASYGITKIESTGNVVDDMPHKDPIMVDLQFFESRFKGVIPFEILISSDKKGSATRLSTLKKIDQLNDVLATHKEFSKPISLVEVYKFTNQAWYNGMPEFYTLPSNRDLSFMKRYVGEDAKTNNKLIEKFIGGDKSENRVTVQIADIGTKRMEELLTVLQKEIAEIFPSDKYKVVTTGSSLIFVKGTKYLVKNLFTSLALAILLISIFMAIMFRSWRMVIISLIPNLLPLLFTGALMGYFGIAIKPSTILVFSIAFGISVDDTIHFLAKYRQELKSRDWKIKESAIAALNETGVSMFYTSIVLFFGFGIFALSTFGGTIALGILVSVTLLIAMKANLILLPSLLLTLDKVITRKSFREPLIEILDEEEDIDLEELNVPNK